LAAWDDAKKAFVTRAEGKVELPGHHVSAAVADDGAHFVLRDQFAGISIHDATGKRIRKLAPEDLLTKEELAARPKNAWPEEHPEGQWSNGWVAFEEDSKRILVGIYTG